MEEQADKQKFGYSPLYPTGHQPFEAGAQKEKNFLKSVKGHHPFHGCRPKKGEKNVMSKAKLFSHEV